VLFILLRLILWKHVIRFLAERKNRVQGEMDEAENRRNSAEALHDKYNEKLENVEAEGQEIIQKSRRNANEESEKILKASREKAKEMIDDAEARIAEDKANALESVQHEITGLATQMASRILEREISTQDNINAVDEFFGK